MFSGAFAFNQDLSNWCVSQFSTKPPILTTAPTAGHSPCQFGVLVHLKPITTVMVSREIDSDCNDSQATVYPGSNEVCDGFDNDCNGTVDDGFATFEVYEDNDGDGFEIQRTRQVCMTPSGYIPIR